MNPLIRDGSIKLIRIIRLMDHGFIRIVTLPSLPTQFKSYVRSN